MADAEGPLNFAVNSAPSTGVRITVRGQTPAYGLRTSLPTLRPSRTPLAPSNASERLNRYSLLR